jgi:type IV pilus assembly protein PilB
MMSGDKLERQGSLPHSTPRGAQVVKNGNGNGQVGSHRPPLIGGILGLNRILHPIPPPVESKQGSSLEAISGFTQALVERGIVPQSVVSEAMMFKRTRSESERRLLFQILIDEFNVDRESVYQEFISYYSFKSLDILSEGIHPERIAFIHRSLNTLIPRVREAALKNKIFPFKVCADDPSRLIIITPDPTNPELHRLSRAYNFAKHEVCYVSLHDFGLLERELLKEKSMFQEIADVEFTEEETLTDELDDEIRRGQLGELVNEILSDAVRMKASDIHVIPKLFRKTEIHFRLDGHLTLWRTIDDIRSDAVAAVVKDLTKGTDRFERNMAQDGYIQKTVENKLVRFRVSIIPVTGRESKLKGESIVIRVLTDPESSITVDSLGFQPNDLARFKQAIEQPYGIVILSGPTGSGKSTTLLAAVRYIMNPGLNIMTVEDPVEYLIDGARQVKLNPKMDFEGALRAILRHDPDVVMVGEIRDRITADIAIKLANTGHLTFTTLHTNDAPSVISRLFKMGVEPFLLASSINAIVAQRLVRKLCDRCKAIEEHAHPQVLVRMGLSEEEAHRFKPYRPVGCIHCNRGFKGRTAVQEVLYFTREIRQLIMDSGESIDETALRRLAIDQGMRTLRQSAVELMKQGLTTVEEVNGTTLAD